MVDFRCYGDVTSMLIKHLPLLLLAFALSASAQREMGIGVPKHIPIQIKVKNLDNENWAVAIRIQRFVRSMSILRRIFGQKSTTLPSEQAVLVHLDGRGLPEHIYKQYDLATIEDRLIEAIKRDRLGEFDGNEIGPDEATLYMYGPDAERLFAGIESILREYPLCQGARVEIRRGAPGAPLREVRL